MCSLLVLIKAVSLVVTAQLGLLNGYLQNHTVNVRLAQCSGWDPEIAYVSYLDGLLFSLF